MFCVASAVARRWGALVPPLRPTWALRSDAAARMVLGNTLGRPFSVVPATRLYAAAAPAASASLGASSSSLSSSSASGAERNDVKRTKKRKPHARNPVRLRLIKKAKKLADEQAAREAAAAARAAEKAAGPKPIAYLDLETVLGLCRGAVAPDESQNAGTVEVAVDATPVPDNAQRDPGNPDCSSKSAPDSVTQADTQNDNEQPVTQLVDTVNETLGGELEQGQIKKKRKSQQPKAVKPKVLTALVRINKSNSTPSMKGLVELPHTHTKKRLSVLCIAPEDSVAGREAKNAGADILGCSDELIADILARKYKINAAVTTPEFYDKTIRIARFLGPLGIMPSTRRGTVTSEIAAAIAKIRRSVRFNISASNTVSAPVGHSQMQIAEIEANVQALVNHIVLLSRSSQGKQIPVDDFVASVRVVPHNLGSFPLDREAYLKVAKIAADSQSPEIKAT